MIDMFKQSSNFILLFFAVIISSCTPPKSFYKMEGSINLRNKINKIIKNSEYNYQTFLAKDLKEKDLDKFKIQSKKPQTLLITGLTLFLSESASLNVKVVNKDVVLFKSIDKEKNYSESGIITRKTGELIHEITKNIKSENSEKYISIYSCTENDKKV